MKFNKTNNKSGVGMTTGQRGVCTTHLRVHIIFLSNTEMRVKLSLFIKILCFTYLFSSFLCMLLLRFHISSGFHCVRCDFLLLSIWHCNRIWCTLHTYCVSGYWHFCLYFVHFGLQYKLICASKCPGKFVIFYNFEKISRVIQYVLFCCRHISCYFREKIQIFQLTNG